VPSKCRSGDAPKHAHRMSLCEVRTRAPNGTYALVLLYAQIAGSGASNAVLCESLLARRVTGGVDHSAIPLVCRGSERLQFSSLERLCVRAAAPVLWPGRANRSW
jgi:hypothetical protein